MFYRFILISVFFLGCNSKKIHKGEIMGLWTDGSSSTSSFEITKDSINNYAYGAYPYKIKGDTIIITRETANILGYQKFETKITLDDDTLIFHFPTEMKKYWRSK